MTVRIPSVRQAAMAPATEPRQIWDLADVAGAELDGHGNRVASMAPLIFSEAGADARRLELIILGARLHDIGKRLIPPTILHAPRRLSPAEWAVMKLHPIFGLEIVCRLVHAVPQDVADCLLLHHEHWDGSGYPVGLSGATIPVPARVIAIADYIDALASPRDYKPAVSLRIVREMVLNERGRLFDPRLTDITLRLWDTLMQARRSADGRPAVTTD
ncbi:HD domain-containing protein [Acetobacter sp. TBRC 12305]|uniref:HD domain-containing protein n=1 Tax=Acetobacter garciniae TaxID=2817435 RepID=A0A939KR13_9PROT|nr:HD domain-containing phosphohydrolase [Acetobacter garciniae]MBO1326214.1 HD domain-containing protein [Acetobacter garciniae]MBX0346049.1 HD domain-containing protein [Acetobacter garciniae]